MFASPSTPPPQTQGWCPGAWQPMASGDGLVVRVRPPLGRLSAAQALQLANLAGQHGAGVLELTSRANIQLRGMATAQHGAVLDALATQGLLDRDARQEQLRNLVIDPLCQPGDGVLALAEALQQAMASDTALDGLPAKFGMSIASGRHAGLAEVAADLQLTRHGPHRWLLQVPGQTGAWQAAHPSQAVQAALALARWCAAQARARRAAGDHPGRLPSLLRQAQASPGSLSPLAMPSGLSAVPVSLPAGGTPKPGWQYGLGLLVAAPLGRVAADALARLARSGIAGLRLTPWRMLLVEGLEPQGIEAAGLNNPEHWITDPQDARLRVSSCSGAPACHQALAPTQDLALALAPHVPDGAHLHVSGCSKGCARQLPATVTLVAQAGSTEPTFGRIRQASAQAVPDSRWSARSLRDNPRLLFEEI
ncbi:precorrin-3B synthase [Comamonas sp. BIGb0152]|uniref:precorrin-3B synthase n=1 Tax=Comamonas sp. BIGb0152 TaxID=2940601 RepID=UPI00216A9ED2|nr:precorrin-3B synthase [Comamonas sp. BIGb0152]MCS4293824.1 precorrin-3B synthase [Comamonas sp. BIGb0152]